MGWMETCAVDQRMRFVMLLEEPTETFAAVCRQFGVSRKTGSKWLARYRTEGVVGLVERSRSPHHIRRRWTRRSPPDAWRCGVRIGAGGR